MELAIDTSTRLAGVALARQGVTVAELTWLADLNHTAQLLPAIDHVLRQQGTKPAAIDLVVIACGPGSFSGLRVGVSAAKGFALALGVPLVGIGTLYVEAYPFLGAGMAIQPVLDAGRGELATCTFNAVDDSLVETVPNAIVTLGQLCDAVKGPTLFCGEHLPLVRQAIAERVGRLASFPPRSALLRRAGNLAELGWCRFARGEHDDPATLQPIYLRPPSITRPHPVQSPVRR